MTERKQPRTLRDVLEAFAAGALELPCPHMELRQEATEHPTVYAGSGLVRQADDGRLKLMLVSSETGDPLAILKALAPGDTHEPGKLLPPDAYHSLTARDVSGAEWRAERVFTDTGSGPGGRTVSGNIFLLEHVEPSSGEGTGLQMRIPTDARIPANTSTETTTKVGVKERKSWALDAARFEACGFQFSMTTDMDALCVRAESGEPPLPTHFETRVVEALQFLTGRFLPWSTLQKWSAGTTTTCLRSRHKPERLAGELYPPIDYRRQDFKGEWAWPLFTKYLEHILPFASGDPFRMHPVSGWLNFARNATAGSVLTLGLALAVAVEGVLNAEFARFGKPAKKIKESIDQALAHIREWDGNAKVRSRIEGFVPTMKTPRAQGRLLSLRRKGVAKKDQIAAWSAIRNAGAHARPPDPEDEAAFQKWIDRCMKVQVLLYRLIFRAIGYEGLFTDYGAPDWAASRYP